MSSSKKSATRHRIVSATLDLLSAEEGGAVRLSDIARKAGLSRQAIYLHFTSRAELLVAATHELDERLSSEARLAPSRAAKTGRARLSAFVEAWCAYVPEIYCVARPLMQMSPKDAEARQAWESRMADMHEGCVAAVSALARDGALAPGLDPEKAADLLWALLLVPSWEALVLKRGWQQAEYAYWIKWQAIQVLTDETGDK